MRKYKRSDFLKLPAGTIYSRLVPKHAPDTGDLMFGLFCKTSGGEYGNDWVEQDLIAEHGFPNDITDGVDAWQYVENLRDTFQDFETDLYCAGRDGLFDGDELCLIVWSKPDVQKLIDYLTEAIND